MESILLGIVQGLTEFLPVSSSGHLVLTQSLIENFSQPGILFDVLLHFATLMSVFLYFRHRITKLFFAFLGIFMQNYRVTYYENRHFLWGIVIASIPTAAIGLYLQDKAEVIFATPSYVGYFLIITSILLVISDRFKGNGQVDGKKSFIMGIIQGLAVIPGISRSGSTVAAGLFLGIKREEIAEFSFLMSLPAIAGATLLQLKHFNSLDAGMIPVYVAGMAAAFISGLIAIGFMVSFIKRAKLIYFANYCLIVGIIAIIWM